MCLHDKFTPKGIFAPRGKLMYINVATFFFSFFFFAGEKESPDFFFSQNIPAHSPPPPPPQIKIKWSLRLIASKIGAILNPAGIWRLYKQILTLKRSPFF